MMNEPQFQVSTHATRAGRDFRPLIICPSGTSFNSRDPCGSRRAFFCGGDVVAVVSTHATRAGRDLWRRCRRRRGQQFQLTRPVRVATKIDHHSIAI